jgi:hypothetical protein
MVIWLHILVVSLLMCLCRNINKDTTNIYSHITTDLIRRRGYTQKKIIYINNTAKVLKLKNLTIFMCPLSWNLEASTSWNPQSLSRPVMGLLYLYHCFYIRYLNANNTKARQGVTRVIFPLYFITCLWLLYIWAETFSVINFKLHKNVIIDGTVITFVYLYRSGMSHLKTTELLFCKDQGLSVSSAADRLCCPEWRHQTCMRFTFTVSWAKLVGALERSFILSARENLHGNFVAI